MVKSIFTLLTSIGILFGCTSNAPEIHTICLRDDIGNYIIKWETYPQMRGPMKMYVSDNADSFNTASPVGYVNIDEGITRYITNDNISRKYFLLSFNDKYYQTVGARSVFMDNVQNLRDMGGYSSNHNRITRWGKIFRSGQLTELSEWDSIRMDNLAIKTIIDLRSIEEAEASPIKYNNPNTNIISIPVNIGNTAELFERLKEGRMRKGDGILYLQDLYLQFITDNSNQFAKALDIFLDESNYPILYSCDIGKDSSGFLSAMLLAALGASESTIMKDYLASNEYIQTDKMAYLAHEMNSDAQEAITVLLGAHESLLDLVFQKIRKDYGSTDKYLSKELQLTEKKRNKLKDILLY